MRRLLIVLFLALLVTIGLIGAGLGAHGAAAVLPRIIPFPIDPAEEPLAAALVHANVWIRDPAKAARIYSNRATAAQAYEEIVAFESIDPEADYEFVGHRESNKSYRAKALGEEVRDAIALNRAIENRARLDDKDFDELWATLHTIDGQTPEADDVTPAQTAQSIRMRNEAGELLSGLVEASKLAKARGNEPDPDFTLFGSKLLTPAPPSALAAKSETTSRAPAPAAPKQQTNEWVYDLEIQTRITAPFQVRRGDTVLIGATGRISIGPLAGYSGPDGVPGYLEFSFFNAPHASLLSRVGSGVWKICGSECAIHGTESGALEFLVNDKDSYNNTGAYKIKIILIRPK